MPYLGPAKPLFPHDPMYCLVIQAKTIAAFTQGPDTAISPCQVPIFLAQRSYHTPNLTIA